MPEHRPFGHPEVSKVCVVWCACCVREVPSGPPWAAAAAATSMRKADSDKRLGQAGFRSAAGVAPRRGSWPAHWSRGESRANTLPRRSRSSGSVPIHQPANQDHAPPPPPSKKKERNDDDDAT